MVKKKKGNRNFWFNSLFAIATFLIVIFFYRNITITTIVLLIIAIIGLIRWKSTKTLYVFILGGIFGTFAEIIAIKFGVWNYTITNFFNIPFWLFIVWGNSSAFIYQSAKEIKEKRLT